jgi:hypothetical protein
MKLKSAAMNLPLFIRLLLLSTLLGLAACGGGGSASDSHPDSDLDSEIGHTDSDQDGIDDDRDMDDDDDSVNDSDDAFPLDSSETLDTDADGVGNNADTDDGVADTEDACPLDASETLDSDADGVCDNADSTPNGVVQQMISGGVVGGFGSIYVNGIRYSTDTAEFVNDSQESLADGEQQLEVGDYVWVEGTLNADGVTGVATRVIYDVDLKGTVSAIDPANRTFTVLGRSVSINQDTVFDDAFAVAELSGLSLGAIVEVTGFDQADGSLLATRIDFEGDTLDTEFKVEGVITAVDLVNQTLNIAAQAVDFSAALIDFTPMLNQWVEVYGVLNAQNVFVASSVKAEDRQGEYGLSSGSNDSDRVASALVSVEGMVSALTTANGFSINGYAVLTDASTLYVGSDVTDINVGTRLLVQGLRAVDSSALVAERIYLRVDANLQVEGQVTDIDLDSNTIVVAGISVVVQPTTQMEDGTGVARRFRLQQLNIGDFVEVSGQYNGSLMMAYRVERDDNDDDLDSYAGYGLNVDGVEYYVDDSGFLQDQSGSYHTETDGSYSRYYDADDYLLQNDYQGNTIEIEGVVSAISSSALTLYGNLINFTATTRFEINDRFVDSATFLASTTVSPYVEVNAVRLASGDYQALTVELESKSYRHNSVGQTTSGNEASELSNYSFELKGVVASIDASAVQLSNGYQLQFGSSTVYETYYLVSQTTFLSAVAALSRPAVEVKVLRNSDGLLQVIKIELESSDQEYGQNNGDDDNGSDNQNYAGSEIEFEGYGAIDNLGATIQGTYVAFVNTTYFELFDRRVQLSDFLAHVSNSDKFEVKARRNAAGDYEAIKVELDD